MLVVPKAVQDSQFEGFTHCFEMLQEISGQGVVTNAAKSYKFSAAHRILRKDGFDRLVHSVNVADKYLKVFFANNSMGNARLGIIASKKIFPHAADRNRIKRVIREAFRRHSIKAKQMDIVVMVRHVCSQEPDMYAGNLEILFSRVESRCAEL